MRNLGLLTQTPTFPPFSLNKFVRRLPGRLNYIRILLRREDSPAIGRNVRIVGQFY
nr:MAG TPA: hypothetical protein [Caudoviricetes sp.]